MMRCKSVYFRASVCVRERERERGIDRAQGVSGLPSLPPTRPRGSACPSTTSCSLHMPIQSRLTRPLPIRREASSFLCVWEGPWWLIKAGTLAMGLPLNVLTLSNLLSSRQPTGKTCGSSRDGELTAWPQARNVRKRNVWHQTSAPKRKNQENENTTNRPDAQRPRASPTRSSLVATTPAATTSYDSS